MTVRQSIPTVLSVGREAVGVKRCDDLVQKVDDMMKLLATF